MNNGYSFYSIPNAVFGRSKAAACDFIVHDLERWIATDPYSSNLVKFITRVPEFNEIVLKAFEEYIYDHKPENIDVAIKCRVFDNLVNINYQKIYTGKNMEAGLYTVAYSDILYNCYFDFVLYPKILALMKLDQ